MHEADDFPSGVAVVVGGSGGLGAAICERLARAGADVALSYRHNRDAAEASAARVRAHGRRATVEAIDLGDAMRVSDWLAACRRDFLRVHTLVLAAGSAIGQPRVAEVDPDEWRRVIDADVHGAFHVLGAALPHLREGGGGAIVYLSSAGLRRHPPGDLLSLAPKAAVEALLRGIAREEGRFGVRANAVALGVVDAGMFPRLIAAGALGPDWLEAAKRNVALRRFATAEEVADVVTFLASRRAAYVTGQQLAVDGGYTL
jgi:NAD(P)-dependent dehydrogenase (short-subunit alcohol dehydrogenase family)